MPQPWLGLGVQDWLEDAAQLKVEKTL